MKKTLFAAALVALTAACGEPAATEEAATANAAAPDHDEAVPTPATEEDDHEHDGNEADHTH